MYTAQSKNAPDEDSAKRRQIIQGARAVFLAQGFDAARMNDIARAAGVDVDLRRDQPCMFYKNVEFEV